MTLRASINYRVSTRFNWYAQPVVALLLGNFEETTLRFYARRAQRRRRRAIVREMRGHRPWRPRRGSVRSGRRDAVPQSLPMKVAPFTTNTASSCITVRFGTTYGGAGNCWCHPTRRVLITPSNSSCGAPPFSPGSRTGVSRSRSSRTQWTLPAARVEHVDRQREAHSVRGPLEQRERVRIVRRLTARAAPTEHVVGKRAWMLGCRARRTTRAFTPSRKPVASVCPPIAKTTSLPAAPSGCR